MAENTTGPSGSALMATDAIPLGSGVGMIKAIHGSARPLSGVTGNTSRRLWSVIEGAALPGRSRLVTADAIPLSGGNGVIKASTCTRGA